MSTPHRRFRFSLRTLMVVVMLVGGWLAWERHIVDGRARTRKAIEIDGGTFFAGDATFGPVARPSEMRPKPPNWIRRQLGDESVGMIQLPNERWDRSTVKAWFPEAELCGATSSDDEASAVKEGSRIEDRGSSNK